MNKKGKKWANLVEEPKNKGEKGQLEMIKEKNERQTSIEEPIKKERK